MAWNNKWITIGNQESQIQHQQATIENEESQIQCQQSTVQTSESQMLRIDVSEISIKGELGAGYFCTIRAGVYKPKNGGPEVECAIKILKPIDELPPNRKYEMLREAEVMASMDHPCIITLYGICVAKPIRMVMELASLGSLTKYLRRHQSLPAIKIINMIVDVSQGMEYLEQKGFVHRDLAARNILVINENSVKISNFGMCQKIEAGNNSAESDEHQKLWLLRWYAPEYLFFAKFDSKSDVWSFGITAWEALSNGHKPYQGLKGGEVMQMLENNQRLDCPDKCPQSVYDVMLKCWSWRAEDRPTFAELSTILREIHSYMQREESRLPPQRPPRPQPRIPGQN